MKNTDSPESKILCVGASPRKGGNSDVLMKKVLEGAGKDSEGIRLRDYKYDPCIGCERCRKDRRCTGLNDGMQLIYPKVLESKGLVLISPTHNYNVTSWMKAFIDRLYCFYNFDDTVVPRAWSSNLAGQGRKAAIIAICEQADKKDMGFTLEAMRLPLEALGYDVVEELAVFKVFARGKVKEEQKILKRALDIGSNIYKSIG
jgi:multimeric flavodoxin WrbA